MSSGSDEHPEPADPAEQTSREGAPETASEATASETTASEAVVQTIECPNCGRTFVGDYCPECGQEADPSTSVTDVIGGFFRELVDFERGIWPTFVGLTLRPGQTLRRYLKGVRKTLARPGRYLIGAIMVAFGTDRVLRWLIDAAESPTSWPPGSPSQWNWDWAEQGLQGALAVVYYWVEQATGGFLVALYLLMPLALSLILHRLYSEEVGSGGEALGLGSFLIGQIALFHAGVAAVHDLFGHDLLSPLFSWLYVIAHLHDPGLSFGPVSSFVAAVYLGVVLYQCFGARWQNYVIGLVVWGWVWFEAAVIYNFVTTVTGFGLVLSNPEVYGGLPEFFIKGIAWVWAEGPGSSAYAVGPSIGSILFLLLAHGALEVYYRYW